MRRPISFFLFSLMTGTAPGALLAQTSEPKGPPVQMDDTDEIIVTGQPQRGAAVGNIKPEQQLSPADVRALGVTSISELISELAPQTNGAPVVLLNGKRISSFSEIQDLPSEAVARVDILPEQVALSYGYAPTQKVVNIVLRQRFRAELADLRAATSTDGGGESGSAEGGLMRIRGDNRLTVNVKYATAASLLESERGINAGVNASPYVDITRYRTLTPATEKLSANATLARALGKVSMSVNGRVDLSDNDALQGLPASTLAQLSSSQISPFTPDGIFFRDLLADTALRQQIRGTTGHLGLTFNGLLGGGWQWSVTGNGDISDTRTRTERSTTIDRANARSRSLSGDLLLSGPLFDLPAGTVISSVRLGASANGFEGRSIRSGVPQQSDYHREIGSGQVSVDVPITSKAKDVLGAVGDIGVNVNAAAQQLSDFGTLSTLGYGLRWRPVPAVQLLASANQDRAAPTGNQISDPEVSTPNVSVFDYRTGQTVFVTRLTGGNAALKESVRNQFRLSATVKPFDKPNLTLTATYLNSRTSNPIAAFPEPTPAIEDAFGDRFTRVNGLLTQINARPINYLRSQSEQLRWGFDLSIPLKSHIQKVIEAWRAAGAKPEDRPKELQDLRGLFGSRGRGDAQGHGQEGQDGAPPPSGQGGRDQTRDHGGFGGQGGGGRPGGGFGGGGRGGGGGRLSVSLYHTWHFTESILIAQGVPELDLLNGDATGSSGGQPRHEVDARVGYSNNGLGARLGLNWESGTHVDGALGGTAGGPARLDFGSLATIDLRLFANLGQMPSLVKQHPFLRGARVSIGIDNLFNARRDVTDATGMTPLRYQPGYLDPLGRTISISFRKLFF